MTAYAASFRGVRLLRLLALATLVLVVALFAFAYTASAQGSPIPPDVGPGAYCVDDTLVNSIQCTANDTRISQLTPTLSDICLTVGDTAIADFTAYLIIGATTRYDIGMYVATDGGSAEIGNSCYKTVLQPVASLDDGGTPVSSPINPLGTGPFKNEDGDVCGEANSAIQADPLPDAIYKFPNPVTVLCADSNNDGVVDPISTCLSWANNAGQYNCTTVSATMPGPGTGSKCNCQDIASDPPILLYSGYDWGDLPDNVIGSPDYPTLQSSGGPYHAVQRDTNADGLPEAQGGIPAVWLGPKIDLTTDGLPNASATGDDINQSPDDEDGVAPLNAGGWTTAAASFNVNVSGTAGACPSTGCKVYIWIDWDEDGIFDQTLSPSVGLGNNTVNFDPSPVSLPTNFYYRVRLYDSNYTGTYLPTGLVVNGEVEDYRNTAPLAVTLADFYAEQVADYIRVTWETNSELNNRGFNLYRGTSPTEPPDRQLNETLIPSQSQGNPGGFIYIWDDHADLVPGTSYFYWLDDVATNNVATRHGPVSVDYSGPTAVTVNSVQANPVATPYALPLASTLLALLVPLAGALAVRRRRA